MKPYGQKRVGFGSDEKQGRARAERDALRHEHRAEVGNDLDPSEMTSYCEACGGPCTGLAPFTSQPSGDTKGR